MKKLSCYIGLLMATLWLAACKSDTPLEPDTTVGDGEQVLEITVDGDFYASSRSTAASAGYKLVSSQAIQHIEHMYAYIFKGKDNDAQCVYVAKLPWEQNSQQGPASLTYRLKEANLPEYEDADMQVLVVAVDDEETYGFPFGGVTDHDDTSIIGESLGDVKLELAEAVSEGKTPEEKAFRMANTEVFSGLSSFKAQDQIIRVDLQRCVAGVLCYLTDIPYYVGEGTEDNVINSIELQLNDDESVIGLNTEYASFYYKEDDSDEDKFGSLPLEETKVIASVDIEEYIYGKGNSGVLAPQYDGSIGETSGTSEQRLYVPALDNGVVKTKENTILFGAYLLPIKNLLTDNKSENATLKLVLKDEKGGQTAFVVTNGTTGDNKYNYSLKANRLYSIGSKPFANDTDSDQPASLKGKEIKLNVSGWEDGSGNVNFPVYSLQSSISADWENQYKNYIFNCMSETRVVNIYLSQSDLNKELQIQAIDANGVVDWIDFSLSDSEWNEDSPGTMKISATDASRIDVYIRLHDYVKKRPIIEDNEITDKVADLKSDVRRASLQLLVDGKVIYTSSKPLMQFNAITYGDVGFSRLDYGAEMGDDGIASKEGQKIPWGFYGDGAWQFYNHVYSDQMESDGEYNSQQAADTNYKGYVDSAVGKTREETIGLSGKYWFLPAMKELQPFIEACKNLSFPDIVNLNNDSYWTSTPYDGDLYRKSCFVNNEGEIKGAWRTDSYYCRQAIKLPNE